jgi:integrase
MATNIETKAARASLPARREPYWSRVKAGCHLGYRVIASGEGTWIARWRDDEGKQHYQALGVHETFDSARKAAESWFSHAVQTDGGEVLTVSQIWEHYIEELQAKGKETGAKDAKYRYFQLVRHTDFGKLPMDKLRSKHIKEWRDAIATTSAPATVNRNLAVLLAAFNMAHQEKLVADDSPWRGIKKVNVPDNRRERVLRAEERARLLDACDDDLRPFVDGLMLTGARPGELAHVTVSCFDPFHGTLRFPKGKTGGRSVPISDKMAALCKAQSKNKLPGALMFTRAGGIAWHRDNWQKPFKVAVEQAGLGDGIVLYTLRHSSISEMIAAGMNAFTVATLTGTSVDMIQKHYGHLFADQVKAALNAL